MPATAERHEGAGSGNAGRLLPSRGGAIRLNSSALAWLLLAASAASFSSDKCVAKKEYDEIVSIVTKGFYDKTFRGLDWSSRVSHHRKSLACNADDRGVAASVNALLSELKASHTALYTRRDLHYWGLNSMFSQGPTDYQLEFSGIWPEKRDGAWYARYVLEGSPAARAGVAGGDELLRVNGKAFEPLSFTGKEDSLQLSSDGKGSRTVTIRADHKNVMQAFIDAAESSRKILKAGNKRVGYFHLWTAREGILKALKEALAEFEVARVDALIIDFRGGYGGTSPAYLDPLNASAHLKTVPKYFLIDDGVRSGKEMLAQMIRNGKLGTLVGSRTAGNFLGATPHRFFDDKYFLLLASFGNGDFGIEGVGVPPDIEVIRCREHCGGRDAQLAKALELAGVVYNRGDESH